MLPARGRRHGAHPDLQPGRRDGASPAIPSSARPGCSRSRSSVASSSSRPAWGSSRSRSIATSRARSSSAGWSSRCPTIRRVAETDALFAALGIGGSELPVELYDNGATHIVVTLGSDDAVAALSPDLVGDRAVRGHGRELHRRLRRDAGRTACSGRSARMRRQARLRGRSRVTSGRHGLAEWGDWIEISQGAEIGRPSTLFARADGAGGGIERVFCGGRAVVVARGEFRL